MHLYKRNRIRRRKNILAAVSALLLVAEFVKTDKKRNYSEKKFWVHPLFALRQIHGFYESIFPTLSMYDDLFRNYTRLTLPQFEDLLREVGPTITKKFVVRLPIPATARLAMTLRYAFKYIVRYFSII